MWEGPYRAAPIDSEAYFLACCRTIEFNPVRAGMVDHPRAHRWSSYRAHADAAADALLSAHAIYRALGRGGEARRKAYRALFRFALDGGFVAALRAATNGGWALGDARFAQQIADPNSPILRSQIARPLSVIVRVIEASSQRNSIAASRVVIEDS